MTDAIGSSLEERHDRLHGARSGQSLADQLNQIGLRCSQRPVISALADDEILGYDEFDAPER